MKTLTIGIAGGSGSGKTTLVRYLLQSFPNNIAVISYDDYYKAHDDMSYEERCRLNYDHPDAFDTELFCSHIDRLCRGEVVQCPVYDFTIHNRSGEFTVIRPKPVLLIDGILLLAQPEILRRLDIRIFLDGDADLRLIRRIRRDMRDRGRSLQSVVDQYTETVKPMYERYVEPSRKYADIVIPSGGKNKVVQELLCSRIREYLFSAQRRKSKNNHHTGGK